jgi:hypothetical protein
LVPRERIAPGFTFQHGFSTFTGYLDAELCHRLGVMDLQDLRLGGNLVADGSSAYFMTWSSESVALRLAL